MNINSLFPLLEQYGLGIALLFGVGYIIVNQRHQFNTLTDKVSDINTKIDNVNKSLNTKIDNVSKSLNARIDKHEQQCEVRHKQFTDYMKNHEGRIANIEGRLTERQQPAA